MSLETWGTLERWEHTVPGEREPFRGMAFGAMDPGRDGFLLTFQPGRRWPVGFASPMDPAGCAAAMSVSGARVLILERQYVTDLRRARSIVELSFTMGLVTGWLVRDFEKLDQKKVGRTLGLHAFEVAPSTWQAQQRRAEGAKRGKGEAARLAMLVGERELGTLPAWMSANKATRTGIAAAWAIGKWWMEVAW